MNHGMTGSSPLSNKHVLTSQWFRGAAGRGSRAGSPSHSPGDTQLVCMREVAAVFCYFCYGFCSPWAISPSFLCCPGGEGSGASPVCPRVIQPWSTWLLLTRLLAGIVSKDVRGDPSSTSPSSCWAAIAWGHFSLIPHSVTSL